MDPDGLEGQAQRYAVLEDPQRRTIYQFVRRAHRPVTREEVAAELDVSRGLAAFHLERLLDAGWLTADAVRPPGRGGPGGGRPAKRYAASSAEVTLEIPARRYALAGRLLARAIEKAGSAGSACEAAMTVAAEEGRRLGADFAPRGVGGPDALVALLSEVGFEPVEADAENVVLANCPFHAVAEASPELVCAMNQSFVQGLVDGLDVRRHEARLAPADGRCCVVVSRLDPTP
jgi:predicted ArsR family transcriptional regulator